jgi:hypothetical protein
MQTGAIRLDFGGAHGYAAASAIRDSHVDAARALQ